jgi:uncharacterized membrane protein (UPF0127 family)
MAFKGYSHRKSTGEQQMSYFITFIWSLLLSALSSSALLAEMLTITCPQGEFPFKVELAQTPQEQQRGLMFRSHLDHDAGMLFVYSKPRAVSMWMKNTPLSLDMIFCDSAGKILSIREKATPYSLKSIGPIEGVTHVLEIKGGSVEKHGISNSCLVKLHSSEKE